MQNAFSSKAIIGLGNPGREYAGTRHNVGKEVIGRIARRWKVNLSKKGKLYRVGEKIMDKRKIILMIPCVYMNESGKAVKKFMEDYNLEISCLLVIHDDADIPLGRIKIVPGGGGGGHKGIISIIESLEAKNFPRLRIGIGKESNLTHHVLGKFTQEERRVIDKVKNLSIEAIYMWIREGLDKTMTYYNRREGNDMVCS